MLRVVDMEPGHQTSRCLQEDGAQGCSARLEVPGMRPVSQDAHACPAMRLRHKG